MIKSVWVKNYRSIADIKVNLEPITILVGHNGSGKSNFVDVFRFIYDACRLGLDAAIINRHGMSALRRWSAKGRPYDVEIGLTIETELITATYSFILGSERRGEYSVKRENCYIKDIVKQRHVHYETSNGSWVYAPKEISPQINDRALLLPLIATKNKHICSPSALAQWKCCRSPLSSLETIQEGERYDNDPDELRNAKGWLRKKFGYKPTIHQAHYTQKIDLEIAYTNSRSFRRLHHAFEEIVTAASNGQFILTPIGDTPKE
jgi:hypothetical protein